MEEFRVWHIDGAKGQRKKYPKYFVDPENKSVDVQAELKNKEDVKN